MEKTVTLVTGVETESVLVRQGDVVVRHRVDNVNLPYVYTENIPIRSLQLTTRFSEDHFKVYRGYNGLQGELRRMREDNPEAEVYIIEGEGPPFIEKTITHNYAFTKEVLDSLPFLKHTLDQVDELKRDVEYQRNKALEYKEAAETCRMMLDMQRDNLERLISLPWYKRIFNWR